jgi:hypothetical protein
MDLTAKAPGHVIRSHSFCGDFIKPLWFNIIDILTLVILEIPASYTAPGIGGSKDKRSSKRSHGLVYFGAGDLVNESLVVL